MVSVATLLTFENGRRRQRCSQRWQRQNFPKEIKHDTLVKAKCSQPTSGWCEWNIYSGRGTTQKKTHSWRRQVFAEVFAALDQGDQIQLQNSCLWSSTIQTMNTTMLMPMRNWVEYWKKCHALQCTFGIWKGFEHWRISHSIDHENSIKLADDIGDSEQVNLSSHQPKVGGFLWTRSRMSYLAARSALQGWTGSSDVF